MSPRSRPRWLRPVIGALIAAAFVYLVARQMDWQSVREVWRSAATEPLVLALVLLASGFAVRIARWWWMLRASNAALSYRACVRPFLVSIAVNNTVPFRAGDVVRATGFRGVLQASPARVVGTLVIERLLDMFVLLTFFFAGLVPLASGSVPRAFLTAGVLLGAACAVAILALIIAPRPLRRLVHAALSGDRMSSGRWSRWAARLRDVADHFFDTLALVQAPARAIQLLALSYLAWTLEGGMYAAVAWSLHTVVAPAGPWFAMATGTLATLIPSSPGYVGTFDYFAMVGLMAYGATRTAATAFALMAHLLLWLPATLAGAVSAVLSGSRQGARRSSSHITAAAELGA